MATSSFFYGGSSAPDQNTVDELIDALNSKVAAADEDRVAAELAASQAQAAATNAELAESNTAGLAAQAQTTLTAAEAAVASANAAVAGTAANAATATTKAAEATASAAAALASQTAADSSASSASTQASNAAASASTATTQATAAGTSATNAASSASAAAGSASTATTQATNSANSATASASSAVDSAASASLANDWATKTSGPVAGGEYSSKYNAQQSASSASASASSASAAASSASAAASSASAASGSASTASTAATAAQAAQTAAEAVYDNFDDRYLGAKASAPSVDNDGNALVTGALYFNSTLGQMAAWNGSSWGAIGSNPDSVLGPASSTDNAIARFDGTTGKLVQNSTATLSDTGDLTVTKLSFDGAYGYGFIDKASNTVVRFNSGAGGHKLLIGGQDGDDMFIVHTDGYFGLNNGGLVYSAASADIRLYRDAANTLAQRNGTNPQTFRLYNTYTDGSNYERAYLKWDGNVCYFGTDAAGTGFSRGMTFQIGGADKFILSAAAAQSSPGVDLLTGSSWLGFGGGAANGWIRGTSTGITLYDNATTNFGLLRFGGTSSSFPALKRSGAELEVRLADDSGLGSLKVATQAVKTSDTTVATTAFVDRLRSLLSPSTGSGGGTAVINDRGSLLSVTAGVTVPANVFSANDTFSIYNNSASNITITQGASLTLRQVGTANTGNRTLAQRGLVTVVFISATEAVISGGGLT